MALQAQTRRTRQATPERWQRALRRALDERVEVRQVNENGMWVATSGTDAAMAYLLEITGGVAHRFTCKAGEFDDPVCKHRAAFYLLIGALSIDPEPDPPAPALAPVVCFRCRRTGCAVSGVVGLGSSSRVAECGHGHNWSNRPQELGD